ncbi:MAG: hypothetical protein ACU83V_06040 [Gammaproteobacteria bacterium]
MAARTVIFTAMLLSTRLLLSLLLVLQFFAPLLHAHARQQDPHLGLHLPGLEAYSTPDIGAFACQTEANLAATGDFIVAVDDGVREKRGLLPAKSSGGDCLPFPAWIPGAVAESGTLIEFTLPPLLPSRPRSLALSPRAPPVI